MLFVTMLVSILAFSSAWTPQVSFDRRAVLSSAAAAVLSAPHPASALSKKAAEDKMLMKETAKEQKQAMKEYKFAPRPELNDDFTFKESTLKAGSTGELADYYKQKGAVLQAQFVEDKVRATGMTKEQAEKEYQKVLASKQKEAASKPKRVETEDERKIREFAEKNKGLRDDQGRLVFGEVAPTSNLSEKELLAAASQETGWESSKKKYKVR